MGESYDGRAAVPSISREGVTQKSCRVTATQSIIKVTEQSVCFGRGGVTAFTERRVTGVLDLSVLIKMDVISQIATYVLEYSRFKMQYHTIPLQIYIHTSRHTYAETLARTLSQTRTHTHTHTHIQA